MRLSTETIRSVQERADILEVVEDYLPLKKKGQNWWALSPFTNEKTPSFSVSPAKGIYKCFSTGKGGDAISFVMEMEGMSFTEAVRRLAGKYGIPIEEEEQTAEEQQTLNQKETLMIVLNFAKTFFVETLHQHPEGQSVGMSYLRERGLIGKTIEKFELGYSLDTWRALLEHARKKGHQTEHLEAAGLILSKEGKEPYDRFRGRVIFPIHNIAGRVIAFGARALRKEDQPKYLNSPETEVYHKSEVLYGIYQARQAIRQQDRCYLVEGYLDVISLHQAGVENVVASSGTSLTEQQIGIIRRLTNQITILYDGDPAGIKASLRGIDLILEKGMDVRVVLFPDGDDPDSYVRKHGGQQLTSYIEQHAKDFLRFKTELVLADSAGDPIKKATLARSVVESIIRIPDPIKQEVFFRQAATLLDLKEETLQQEGARLLQQQARKEEYRNRTQTSEPEGKAAPLEQKTAPAPAFGHRFERELIRLLVLYGTSEIGENQRFAHSLLNAIRQVRLEHPLYQELVDDYLLRMNSEQLPDSSYFIHHLNPQIQRLAVDFLTEGQEPSANWQQHFDVYVPPQDKEVDKVAYNALLWLKYREIKALCVECAEKMKEAHTIDEQTEYFRVMAELNRYRKEIAGMLGVVIA